MSGTVLTNKGLALITKLVAASTELQISRVAVGTGRVPSGVDPQTMVDLNEYKMDAQIESYGVSPDQSDVAYIAAQVSSIGVSAGFAVTEAGVFATDPDVGEILYAYLDLTEDPQYIYAETDAISKFAEITFNVLIGSVAKVTAYVSPGALTKKVDFNAFKESVETPEFDDSGAVEGISSFPSFLETMKSKMNFFQFFRNLKAGLQFVLHAGQIVNNCVTDNAGLPLSAAQGKVLKDLYTQLYSDIDKKKSPFGNALEPGDVGLNCYGYLMSRFGLDGVSTSQKGDKYYLAVSSKGQIYGGAQINGAENITWKESASKTDLPNIFTAKLGTSNQESNHATTIKGLWNSFPENQVFACNLVDINNFCVFGFIYANHKYGAVLYLAFNDCGIVKCNNGTFRDTKLL
nr:MAG TPA: tail-collar fiber protein [Caudoviricetes sp.]